MKNLSLLALLFTTIPVRAAFPVTAVAEVNGSATAGNVNGCWFDSAAAGGTGVDYSQTTTFKSSGTILSSNDALAVTSCTVNAAGYVWGTDIIGNGLHVSAGTNWISTSSASWHIILTTGTSSGDLGITGPCGNANVLTNGTFYIGGACSLNSTLDQDFLAIATGTNGTGENKIWVKSGTVSIGETVSGLQAGASQARVVIQGYNAARGDLNAFTSYSLNPTLSPGVNNFTAGSAWNLQNINFIVSVLAGASSGTNSSLTNIKCLNNSTTSGRACLTLGGTSTLEIFDVASLRGVAISGANASARSAYGWIHNSDVGFTLANTVTVQSLDHILFENNVSTAVRVTGAISGAGILSNATIHGYSGNQQLVGFSGITGATNLRLYSNIFDTLARAVNIADTVTVNFGDYNIYNATASANTNWVTELHSMTVNPQFANVYEVSGTAATTTAGNHLVDASATFQTWGITPGRDYLFLKSGTGTTNQVHYTIASVDSQTQITVGETLTANATGDHAWIIGLGHDYRPGANVFNGGYPGLLGNTTGYSDPGAFQHRDAARAYAR